MGPYDISNNERHVHTIDGHTKCLYAKFALEWKISDTEKNTIYNVIQLAEVVDISARTVQTSR